MPWQNPLLRSSWEDLLKGEFCSLLGLVRVWDRTPLHRRELGWNIFQKLGRGFRPRNPSLSNSHLSPENGMASMSTDARNGRRVSEYHHRCAVRSSPHGVWDLGGGEHSQPPGGPVLFQRWAQDQGSFGVGIVCGQCHKGLILIQRKKQKIHYNILPRKSYPGSAETSSVAKINSSVNLL